MIDSKIFCTNNDLLYTLDMHWIERHILKVLAFNDTKRYSELKPDSVDGNLFQYHARQLEKLGLIERNSTGYRLTSAGKIFVADLSQSKLMNARKTPRTISMIIAKNNEGQYLLFKWKRQPYRGLVSFVFGRQLYGQPAIESAKEQLLFKTGYHAEFCYVGSADIINAQQGDIVDHLSANILEANNMKKVTEPDGLTGDYFWGQPEEHTPDRSVIGFIEIYNWINEKNKKSFLDIYY